MEYAQIRVDKAGRIYLPRRLRSLPETVYVAKIGDSLIISPSREKLEELAEALNEVLRERRAEEALRLARGIREKVGISLRISPEELEREIEEAVADGVR